MYSIRLTLAGRFRTVWDNPSIILDVLQGKSKYQLRLKVRALKNKRQESKYHADVDAFIASIRAQAPNKSERLYFNKVCRLEDWENTEFRQILQEIQPESYYHQCGGVMARMPGLIHRKDWEWVMGIIAMKRLGMLSQQHTALGVGTGKELILFYLANKLDHVVATDLYNKEEWQEFAPADFPENPKKYAPFQYREHALTALRMDGRKLEFPAENFDIAFSFSSIEHFGGANHSGGLESLKEMERVLKPAGIAVVSTDYILNGKEPPDLTNQFYNEKTIYSDLIDKLNMKLVEPLDLKITAKTLGTILNVGDAYNWDTNRVSDGYKRLHPYIVLKFHDILVTSILLVFRKA